MARHNYEPTTDCLPVEIHSEVRHGEDHDGGAAVHDGGESTQDWGATGAESKDPTGGADVLQTGELQHLHRLTSPPREHPHTHNYTVWYITIAWTHAARIIVHLVYYNIIVCYIIHILLLYIIIGGCNECD